MGTALTSSLLQEHQLMSINWIGMWPR
uniref:Uncharacterized protein n=1 Tax=Rhizophora mucronata TaxID=61149 RepID=A0A2P2LLK1_RHIMU